MSVEAKIKDHDARRVLEAIPFMATRFVNMSEAVVMKGVAMAITAAVGVLAFAVSGYAAEKFQKLGGSQIRAKFVGMEMTDNVHYADVFAPNGDLRTYSMGRKKDGKWRVEKDEICVDRGKDDGGCYQVWLSGKNVEFRREGLPAAFDGILQRPTARN